MKSHSKSLLRMGVALMLSALLAVGSVSSFAQRGRSFGGGGRSFGGGGGSFGGGTRSFGGGGGSFGGGGTRSFGGGGTRSSGGGGGSFGGGGTRSFGGGASSSPRSSSAFGGTNSGSFGRSGSFNSTRGGISPGYTRSSNTFSYNGVSAPIRGYGGFHASYYWGAPHWYYWTPFHPAFYYSPPIYVNGYYEPGGFSFMRLILSGIFFVFFLWLIVRIFSGGRGGGPRYTTYN